MIYDWRCCYPCIFIPPYIFTRVLSGASGIMFFVIGGFKSLGVIFVAVLDRYHTDATVTAWIIGVLNAGMSFFGESTRHIDWYSN